MRMATQIMKEAMKNPRKAIMKVMMEMETIMMGKIRIMKKKAEVTMRMATQIMKE